MADTAHVPQLHRDATACIVHRLHDRAPAKHLGVGPDAGCAGISDAAGVNHRGFGQDQACLRTLGVVTLHQRDRYPLWVGAHAREWGHHDTVRQVQRAQLQGFKEGGHRGSVRVVEMAP